MVKNVEAQGISTIEGMSGSTLPLKIEADTMGIKISQVATDLSKGNVSSSKFALPTGIEFENDPAGDRMMKEQARTAVQNLAAGKPVIAGAAQPFPAADYTEDTSADRSGTGRAQDADDVDLAARQETKEASIPEVEEGGQSLFKSLFD